MPSKTGGRSSSSAGGAGAGASGPAGGAGGVTSSGLAGGAGSGTSPVPAGGAGDVTSSRPAGGAGGGPSSVPAGGADGVSPSVPAGVAGGEMTSGSPGRVGGWTSSSIGSASGAAGAGSRKSAIFSSICGGGGGGKASRADQSCVVAAGMFVVVGKLEEGRLGGVGKRIFPLFLLPRIAVTWAPNSALWAKERASAGISCTLARAAAFPGAWYFRLGTSSTSGGKDIRLVRVLPGSLCFFPPDDFAGPQRPDSDTNTDP